MSCVQCRAFLRRRLSVQHEECSGLVCVGKLLKCFIFQVKLENGGIVEHSFFLSEKDISAENNIAQILVQRSNLQRQQIDESFRSLFDVVWIAQLPLII